MNSEDKLLDDVGLQILYLLQENARISFTEIGRRVGLTSPAVAERVHRMEEAGIITGYHAHVDPDKLGKPIMVFIHVGAIDRNCLPVREMVRDIPEVLECYQITGDDDLIIKAVFKSMSQLEKLIERLIPLGRVNTAVVLGTAVPRRSIR